MTKQPNRLEPCLADELDARIDAIQSVPGVLVDRAVDELGTWAFNNSPAILSALRAQPDRPADVVELWLWREGENFVAYDTLFPCFPNGDPLVLGEPAATATYRPLSNGDASVGVDAADLRRAFEDEGCYLARFFANGGLHLPPEAETTAAFERIVADLSNPAASDEGLHGKFHMMLRNLLAVIHRDGGHRTQEIGIDLAWEQALQLSSERIAASDRAEKMREALRLAADRLDAAARRADEDDDIVAKIGYSDWANEARAALSEQSK